MRRQNSRNRGNVTVETLVVLPFLLFVVTVAIELSILSYKKVALVNAVELAAQMYAATLNEERAREEVLSNYPESLGFTFSCWVEEGTHLASCQAHDIPSVSLPFLKNTVKLTSKSYTPAAD